ncbi:MAG: LLM class flavin-dependent oxidoreductase, partial [Acinetobacter tjernbergiae]
KIANQYDVDEFIFTCDIYDTQKRLENFSLLMDIKKD